MKGTLHTQRLWRLFFAAATFVLLAAGALIGAPAAAAITEAETVNPFAFDGFNPCTTEYFSGTGSLHFLIGSNLSNGGMAQSHYEANLQGLKATTLLGKKYVVVDTSNQTIGFDTTDLMPFHEKLEWTVQFIRQGEDGTLILGDDFYEYMRTHITANANGMVTAFSIRTNDMPCQ